MNVAAAVNENRMDALIPGTMEMARGVLIFDAELEGDDPNARYVTEDLARAMIDTECEALLCGFIYDPVFFDAVADAGITRYLAADLTVREAKEAMNSYQLTLLRDYVGGFGHDHCHREEEETAPDCDGDCASCALDCSGEREAKGETK